MQRQALRGVGEEGDDDGHESGQGGNGQRSTKKKVEGMGPLFGGVAALQAMGQMILGVRSPVLSFICFAVETEYRKISCGILASHLRCPLLVDGRYPPKSDIHARRRTRHGLARHPLPHPCRTKVALYIVFVFVFLLECPASNSTIQTHFLLLVLRVPLLFPIFIVVVPSSLDQPQRPSALFPRRSLFLQLRHDIWTWESQRHRYQREE